MSTPEPTEAVAESDRLLLDAIDHVLAKVIDMDSEDAKALAERAMVLNSIIADWHRVEPSPVERHDITGKVLGLHIMLSRIARGERK